MVGVFALVYDLELQAIYIIHVKLKNYIVCQKDTFLYRHLHPRLKYKTEQIILHQHGREHRGN